jgi:capsular exopolysaccharide synthesis family protein
MQESETLDIAAALRVIRRRAPLVALCAIVLGGAAFGFSRLQAKEYTATSALVFQTSPLSSQVAGLSGESSGSQFAKQLSNVALVGLGETAARTAAILDLSEAEVAGSVEAHGEGESNVVEISATSTSPVLAARIATVYAEQFAAAQHRASRRYFKSALKLVERQLRQLPPAQRFGPVAVPLESRAQSLRLLEGLNYDQVTVAQRATVPTSPSAPKTVRNVILGVLLGLLVGIGLAFLLERIGRSRRLREPEDLESLYGAPILGAVPASRALGRGAVAAGTEAAPDPASLEAEAFGLIRARLRFAPGASELRTVLVTSAERMEGTTTVALGLAEAAARMGAKALLIEANFRHPVLAERLGLHPGATLIDLLTGRALEGASIRTIPIGAPAASAEPGRTLDVLACGGYDRPANPGELLESHAMHQLLDRARSLYDLVIIDAPPPTVVSDAYPLLGRADGAVIVGWVDRSGRTAAANLRRALDGAGANVLGVVANGVRHGDLDEYGGTGGYGLDLPLAPAAVSANGAAPVSSAAPGGG